MRKIKFVQDYISQNGIAKSDKHTTSKYVNFTGDLEYFHQDGISGFFKGIKSVITGNGINPKGDGSIAPAPSIGSISGGAGVGGAIKGNFNSYTCQQLASTYNVLNKQLANLIHDSNMASSGIASVGGGSMGGGAVALPPVAGGASSPVAVLSGSVVAAPNYQQAIADTQSQLLLCLTAMYNKKCNCGNGNANTTNANRI